MNIRTVDHLLKQMKEKKAELEKVLDRYDIPYGENSDAALFQTACERLKDLKVAAIMDAFTLGNFRDECNLLELTAYEWQSQMEAFQPDMLFVESAWNGKEDSWYKKIANGSKELYDLTEYCHAKAIPVVFWNKEDPIYTDVFMAAAACADYVFTTDFDCIEKYKRTLQHNNVYLLPFSAQPRVHNPIEIHDRKDKFCFAGAYYHRYKERSMVFDAFADVFEQGKGLDIFDRNLGSARPEHAFPPRYHKMILGSLKPEEIHIAYKGYHYGVNMNSVGQSQSMFARRVFELLASNTVSVGNYARGVKNFFGDLTISTDNAETMKNQLEKYCGTRENYRKYRLLGLRKVLENHLCEDRLGFVTSCVFGKDMRASLPEIVVVSNAETQADKQKVSAAFLRQTYPHKTLFFLKEGEAAVPAQSFVAAFSARDYYGENYLKDLALSVRYSGADGFGKNNFYEQTENGIACRSTDDTYKSCSSLFSTRSIVKASCVRDIAAFAGGTELSGAFFCTDEFHYCRNYEEAVCPEADDLFVADQGISLSVFHESAACMNYSSLSSDLLTITPQELMEMTPGKIRGVDFSVDSGKYIVASKLDAQKHSYIYFSKTFPIEEFYSLDKFSVLFDCSGDLETVNFCVFYDGGAKEMAKYSSVGNRTISAQVPTGARYLKILLRIKGAGVKKFSGIRFVEEIGSGSKTPFLSRSDVLVIADHYPSYEHLYRYMFVHKRISLYKENGLVVDMMRINMFSESCYSEFESVNVVDGDAERLSDILETGRIHTVCVHFLNPYIWSILKNYAEDIRILVWCHGSEIQPWQRRLFNLRTESEIAEAKAASEKRSRFWQEVFRYSEKGNLHFVLVSQHFKKEIEEDYGVDLSGRSSVIHNCIDTDMFRYEKKDPAQRFRIMTVKSFDSKTYANDITQKAIVLLSKEPEFKNMTFDLYGDGAEYEEDTRHLKKFRNVHLHRRFLPQREIAELHKTHGVYIATTRMDTQGVSRDEAMSSGLVPIANAVAAVPEFVDDTCGILVPAEDAEAVAAGILKLVRNPELFETLSENAAKRVRNRTAKPFTIDRETALIENRGNQND